MWETKITFTYPDLLGDLDLDREADLLLLRALPLEALDLADWFDPASDPSSEKLLFSESDMLEIYQVHYTKRNSRI